MPVATSYDQIILLSFECPNHDGSMFVVKNIKPRSLHGMACMKAFQKFAKKK